MKPAINKLLTNIQPTFDIITTSIQIFWQRHRRMLEWAIGLTLLILLAAILFVRLWSRFQLFRILVLIVMAAIIMNSNSVINWLTKHARELQGPVALESSLTQKTSYDPHEAQGGEISQGLKVEPDPRLA